MEDIDRGRLGRSDNAKACSSELRVPATNSTVAAGWNYWTYSYADKRSGDWIYSAGNALKTAAVRNNLFRLEAVPAGDVASFVALDGSRNVVYSTPAE